MTLQCAILDDYQDVALRVANWSQLKDRVNIINFTKYMDNINELVESLADKDIIVVMRERTPFPRALFERLPRLKLLVTTGLRNASIDLVAAQEYGVVVCGTDSRKEPPMELAWGLILSLARQIPQEYLSMRSHGAWQSTLGTGLSGKQLGLLGLGKIGSLMVPVAKAFGMQVMAWSQHLTQDKTDSLGVTLAPSKEALLESSDFVSIHLVLSERTKHLLQANDLKRMRRTAYLINTSRAAIIEPQVLIDALQNQWIAGAGLDVYETEPLPADDILRRLHNVITTPHLGYVTQENYQQFYGQAVENIEAFLQGVPKRLLS